MRKNIVSTGISMAVVLTLAGSLAGCGKTEQPKEEPKAEAQQAAPATPAAPAAAAAQATPSTDDTAKGSFSFEDGAQNWAPLKGSKVAQDRSQFHGGNASLKISGTSAKGNWNFAESPKFKIRAGKHYKFSGWVKVESFASNDPKKLTCLKVIYLKDGTWTKSTINTNYDFSKKGQWQSLTGEFDAPAGSDTDAKFTVDKRPAEKEIAATIYVDDVSIEPAN